MIYYRIALRIGEDGEYILNGNFMVMHRKVIVHSGVTIDYSGPESIVERLNSSRPITIDLILEAGPSLSFTITSLNKKSFIQQNNFAKTQIQHSRYYL